MVKPSTATADPALEPMLRIQVDDPLARGRHLAGELGAELCETAAAAVSLLEELSAFPPLGTAELELVRALSDRVTAARRIVERTTDRAAAEVAERFAASGLGLALHPVAVRDRAAAVVAARDALAGAEERLATAEAEADAADVVVVDAPAPLAPAPAPAPVEPPRRRRWFDRARDRRYEEDVQETTTLLHQVMATTEEAFGARRANEARTVAVDLLRAQRDRALEDVRLAEHAWRDLAGDDDVEDVEVVVKRFDPQHQEARVVAQESVGVRAVGVLLQQALTRWDDGWRSVGVDPPESVDPEWVEQMVERMTRPVVLVGDATDYAERVAAAAPAASVRVVEPSSPS